MRAIRGCRNPIPKSHGWSIWRSDELQEKLPNGWPDAGPSGEGKLASVRHIFEARQFTPNPDVQIIERPEVAAKLNDIGGPTLFLPLMPSFSRSTTRSRRYRGREGKVRVNPPARSGQHRRGVLRKQLAICAGLLLLGFGATRLAGAQSIYADPGYGDPGAPYAAPGHRDPGVPYAGSGYREPGAPHASPGYADPRAPDPALPPYEIMSIVRSTGLAPLTRPMRRGRYYVLVAVDRVGRQMRVVVDAQLGDVVNMRPAMTAGPYGPEVARSYDPELARPNGTPGSGPAYPDTATGTTGTYGWYSSGESAPPTPPRAIPDVRTPDVRTPDARAPNFRAANVPNVAPPPNRLAVPEPALPPPPPLPRPRPKMALNEAPAAPPSPAPNAAADAAKPIE
jgi:hypothetical protein